MSIVDDSARPMASGISGSARPEAAGMDHGFVGLPMPASKDLVLDPAMRPHVRQVRGPRFPFPDPERLVHRRPRRRGRCRPGAAALLLRPGPRGVPHGVG